MIRVIIPAYNEERNLEGCVKEIAREIKKIKEKYRFYIVDDGSTDSTPKILSKLKNKFPLEIITHKPNKGVPEAFRSGFIAATKRAKDNDTLILMEADATSDARLIPKIVSKIKNGNDIVISSRYIKGGKYKNFPLRRLILSYLANIVMKILFPIKGVKDYTIFYRGYKAWTIKRLIKKYGKNFIKTKFYVANSEVLIKIAKFSPKITEIPLVYNYGRKRKPSAMKILSNIRAYLNFIYRQYISS